MKNVRYILFILILSVPSIQYTTMKINGHTREKNDCFVFISVSKEKRIAVYRLDTSKGTLLFQGDINLSGEPGSLCLDPSHKYLFAALRSTQCIAGMNLDPVSGSLKPIADTPVSDNPVFISTAGQGKYLMLTSYSGNKTAVHPVNKGIVNPDPTYLSKARVNPHMIKTDPSDRYVLVPNLGGNVIQQFILQEDGSLKANQPAEISVNNKNGPRHFDFHPSMPLFYLINELSSTVMLFKFDEAKGTLSGPFQEISTLPGNFSAKNSCADIHLTPDGKFLYASNRGHNSIAAYKVNRKDGTLRSTGIFPTEKIPRSFAIDPSGKFLISAGEGSGKAALSRIKTNGALSLLETYEIGKWPVWVITVECEEK